MMVGLGKARVVPDSLQVFLIAIQSHQIFIQEGVTVNGGTSAAPGPLLVRFE